MIPTIEKTGIILTVGGKENEKNFKRVPMGGKTAGIKSKADIMKAQGDICI